MADPTRSAVCDGTNDSSCVALTIPGVDAGVWQVRNRFDSAANRLANRHYSREKQSNQAGGPGYVLVLVTPCERAAWISKRHSADTHSARVLADGYPPDTYRCALFRNEGAGLSSDLIREAMLLTERMWGVPQHGWQTYVDRAQIGSPNPGYCFKRAGWVPDRWRGSKLSLIAAALATPEARKEACLFPLPDGRRCLECETCQPTNPEGRA